MSLSCMLMQISVGSGDVRVISKRSLLLQKDSSPRILSSVSVLIALLYRSLFAVTERLFFLTAANRVCCREPHILPPSFLPQIILHKHPRMMHLTYPPRP